MHSTLHRIAPTRWHALDYGLATGLIVALVALSIWLAQSAEVTISGPGAVPAELTVTADGPVQIVIIAPAESPNAGIDA
jgi:hypothetical protein